MPFLNKSFTQLLNNLIVHLTTSSNVSDMNTGSAIRSILESVALLGDEAYFQIVNLFIGFYFNTASGSDLDRRASDFDIQRKLSTQSTVLVTFSGSGTPIIPAGTLVAVPASGSIPQINFITTTSGTIADVIVAVSQVSGEIGNVGPSAINTIVTNPNPSLITGVTNAQPATGGQDQEADNTFRSRIQAYLLSLSKGTTNSIISACLNVPGVTVAEVLQRYSLSGYQLSPSPITDLVNGATLNPPPQLGDIVVVIDNGSGSLSSNIVPIVQNILLGDTSNPDAFPGYVGAGIQCFTTRPEILSVTASMTIEITSNIIDTTTLKNTIQNSLATFISQLGIGAALKIADIVEQTMLISGVSNVINTVGTPVLINGVHADSDATNQATKLIVSSPTWLTITI